jgi:1,4-alpha-glucan branching enzyme
MNLPDPAAIEAIVAARHGDPFAVLGPHGGSVRAFLPTATRVDVLARGGGARLGTLERIHPAGFWCGEVSASVPYVLGIDSGGTVHETEDPYSFGPALGDLDVYLLAEGHHREIGRTLGAQLVTLEGVRGVRFAVWAPNARRVSVVGDFNRWDGRVHPMRLRHNGGVWELFIPRLGAGALYKYELVGPDGGLLALKADPVATSAEPPPATASVVADPTLRWRDREWLARRAGANAPDAPMTIYEVHAASWLPGSETGASWQALADRLVPYVQAMGFTHVEFMPVMEHPFGGSWGYQALGLFAPSARLGPPVDFARLIDAFHEAGIGVVLDWVPAHFPTDAHGLARFDGTALYEHADPKEGYQPDWNTYIFNLGRSEVRGFLIGSALHWIEQYHVDGLRVDAVASMLYRDYSRREGEWVPNRYGGRENLEAISFLQELAALLRQRCPGVALMAEESTAWPGVTRGPADPEVPWGGLGFSHKWNMGWMHDTLHYMHEDPVHRRWHHDEITFGLIYAFFEKFILPLSHDEVVYGKGSLLNKMPGDEWQRFANLRAYLGFMWAHPGKKLLFMGGEFAQWNEWDHNRGLDWHLLEQPRNAGMQRLVRELNRLYRATSALWRRDFTSDGFRWVVLNDREQSVFAFLRFGFEGDAPVLAVCNFTPLPRHGYRIGVPRGGNWRETFNSDGALYGGSNLGNGGGCAAEPIASHGEAWSLSLILPPLATIYLQAPP